MTPEAEVVEAMVQALEPLLYSVGAEDYATLAAGGVLFIYRPADAGGDEPLAGRSVEIITPACPTPVRGRILAHHLSYAAADKAEFIKEWGPVDGAVDCLAIEPETHGEDPAA